MVTSLHCKLGGGWDISKLYYSFSVKNTFYVVRHTAVHTDVTKRDKRFA